MPAPKRTTLTPLAIEVLGLLHEKPMHPYEMQQLMRQRRADLRVKIRAGSLYHTVDRLVEGGEIEVVDTERDGRRPERTVYGLTEAGRDALSERVSDMLATPADERPQFLVALSAADDIPYDEAVSALKMRVMNLSAKVAATRTIVRRLGEMRLPELYWMDYQFLLHQQEAELDWTRALVERLQSGDIPWEHPPWTFPELSVVRSDEETA